MSFDSSVIDLFGNTAVVSIPFEQGYVFRLLENAVQRTVKTSLNPFRTGRCLSTDNFGETYTEIERLNPFRTGRCLSTNTVADT